MLRELEDMIERFRFAQDNAAKLLFQEIALPIPASNRDWVTYSIESGLTSKRQLSGFPIRVHGFGIEISLAEYTIDFDFGDAGELDGFDAWRLWNFYEENQIPQFADQLQIAAMLKTAHDQARLIKDFHLYYDPKRRSTL